MSFLVFLLILISSFIPLWSENELYMTAAILNLLRLFNMSVSCPAPPQPHPKVESHSIAQAGVKWCDLSSLQPLPPGSSDSPASASPSGWDYRCMPSHPANFCIFSRDGVLPCWPGWFQTPDLVIHPSQPPKVLKLQA